MIKTAKREKPQGMVVSQFIAETRQTRFGEFRASEAWSPAMNVYQLEDRLEICFDLSGMEADAIDVHLEPGKLSIGGRRNAPEPPREQDDEPMRIVSMEIDHGRFCRSLSLPANVDIRAAKSRYEAGLLWVTLPLRKRR